jgi:hypothetical protein
MKPSILLYSSLSLLASSISSMAALVAWYPLDEGSGSTAGDASGNGNRLDGNVTWLGTGAFGGSANVGANYGNGSLLARTGGSGSLAGINATTGNQVSISFWLKPDAESQGSSPFWIGDSSTAAGNRVFQAHLEWTDGNTYWDVSWGDGTNQRLSGMLGTVSDALHHYVLTYNGDTGAMNVYKDGVPTLTGTAATQASLPWASINNFEIGAASFGAFWPGGQVDDFAIFNHELSQAEVNTARTQGIAGLVPEPSTVAILGLGGLLLLRRRRQS